MAKSRKSRRRQRLSILIGGFLALVVLVVGAILSKSISEDRRRAALRDEGMSAYAEGRYEEALTPLLEFTREEAEDAEALTATADAILSNPDVSNFDTSRAADLLTRARRVDRSDPLTNRLLLDLARTFYPPADAEELTSDLLRDDPDNAEARKIRAEKRGRLEDFAGALEDANLYLVGEPTDYEAHIIAFTARRKLNQSKQEIVDDARELMDDNPDDPRFRLVAWAAHYVSDQPEQATAALLEAAEMPAPDAEFIFELTYRLDQAREFQRASNYMVEQLPRFELDRQQRYAAAHRLFETSRFDEALRVIEDGGDDVQADLTAIRALIALEQGDRTTADAALAELGEAERARSKAWATMLERFYKPERIAAEVIEAGNEAIAAGLYHPYVLALAGDAHASIGDRRTSKKYQSEAGRLALAWATPRILLAKDHLAEREWSQAEIAAIEAQTRRPDLVEPLILRAIALGSNPETRRVGKLDAALRYIATLRRELPREERLLLTHVQLLGAAGDAVAARAIAREALTLDPPVAAETLDELARISSEFNLGVGDAAVEASRTAYGQTPAMTYREAIAVGTAFGPEGEPAGGADPAAGLEIIDAAAAKDAGNELPWALVRAKYLEVTDDPAAVHAYRTVSETWGDRINVQRQVLSSSTARRDRDLAEQVIDRIKRLAGEKSGEYQIERAKWLLTGPTPREDAAEAERLLGEALDRSPDDAEAFLLRAKSRELGGRLDLAVTDAKQAQSLRPEAWQLLSELARLHNLAGNNADALVQLRKLADHPGVTTDGLRRTADLLARLGDDATATAVLETLQERDQLRPADSLLLARIYARTGRDSDAQWVVDQLLEKPNVPALAFAADFTARRGDVERGRRILDRLESIGAAPEEALLARAAFAASHSAEGAGALL